MNDDQKIEEAAKAIGKNVKVHLDNEHGSRLITTAHDIWKSGIAWRDQNPKPHPDTEMLEWMIDKFGCGVDGEWHLSQEYIGAGRDMREAIRSAMNEGKVKP
jgi:hypothetical protein